MFERGWGGGGRRGRGGGASGSRGVSVEIFMVDSQLDFSFSFSRNAAQKNLKKNLKNQRAPLLIEEERRTLLFITIVIFAKTNLSCCRNLNSRFF